MMKKLKEKMLKNQKSNNGFVFLWSLFIVFAVVDFYTTTSLGELGTVLETNPLFSSIGFVGLALMNLVVIGVLWFAYNHKRAVPGLRFYLINVMILNIAMRIMAISNAMALKNNPISVEVARSLATEAVKQNFYMTNMLALVTPFVIAILTYWFWRPDHEVHRKS